MTATLLDDATQARVVAAYLKRHPESLVFGRPEAAEPDENGQKEKQP